MKGTDYDRWKTDMKEDDSDESSCALQSALKSLSGKIWQMDNKHHGMT